MTMSLKIDVTKKASKIVRNQCVPGLFSDKGADFFGGRQKRIKIVDIFRLSYNQSHPYRGPGGGKPWSKKKRPEGANGR